MSSFGYDTEKTCDVCGGDGRIEYDTGDWDYFGSPITHMRECRTCDGNGRVTVHVRPIDFEDLADVHGDDDRI